jgi:predicted nucleotidyltransferase
VNIKDYKFYHELIKLPFINQIWLFGSRARHDNQERADIDLAIQCPQASLHDWLRIQSIIDDADTLLQIDCIRMDELDNTSPLKSAIKTQGIKLYEKP